MRQRKNGGLEGGGSLRPSIHSSTHPFLHSSLLLLLLALPCFSQDDGLGLDEKKPKAKGDDLEAADKAGTGTLFRLVAADRPSEGLAARRFWRVVPGYVAAETTPVRVQVSGDDVIGPREVVGDKLYLVSTIYPTQGRKELAEGKHPIFPGHIILELKDGKLLCDHPAIQMADGVVRIRCAPVRFDAVDSSGAPVPVPVSVRSEKLALLRQEGKFNPLILWLPVGVQYDSSFGSFHLTPDGTVQGDALNEGVSVQGGAGLRLSLPKGLFALFVNGPSGGAASPAAQASEKPAADIGPAGALYLLSHRGRAAFAETEEAPFQLIAARGLSGGEASILCAPNEPRDAKPLLLGKVTLPAVNEPDFDSRGFILRVRDLAPGDYRLWAEAGVAKSEPLPLAVVPWYRRSDFFVHTMSGCTECWPASDDGLKMLYDAGAEMGTCTGFQSQLDTRMPKLDPKLARPGPAERALRRSENGLLLERMLRHQIRLIDLAPLRAPGAGMYCETLSYHHSYKPSVDRMIRHMQVYTQQTVEYPSFYGVNYSWFPALYGYAEAGVPCDAHVGDRNRVLAENVAKAGFVNPSREDRKWYEQNKFSEDPERRAKALKILRAAIDHWLASNRLGFGEHNRLYNEAIWQVLPRVVCTLFENAGHDALKPARYLFGAMAAACYESYTDFGDWPMSSAFTVDWARGNFPGQPVWLTTCTGTSSEGKMKSLFQAFARGMAGGGVPMQESFGLQELARRGTGMAFTGQYGAIAARATPDNRFAVLSTDSEQVFGDRTQYAYHAMYYHLTRLGCAPIILAERDFVKGGRIADFQLPNADSQKDLSARSSPSSIGNRKSAIGNPAPKVLFIVRQQQPFEPELAKSIEVFQKSGGKVVMTGDCLVKVDDAIVIPKPIKHIWELSGFEGKGHAEMWNEFETNWRGPLADALKKAGVPPLATTDPDRGIVASLQAGAVRYIAVIADAKGTHSNAFEPTEALPVSIEGTGWTVRDLVKQQTLDTREKDGRTEVTVDLITEPTTFLAAYRGSYKTVPAAVQARAAGEPRLGADLVFTCQVFASKDGPMGSVPVRYTLYDAAGGLRATLHRAAEDQVRFPLPALDRPGGWKLVAQELLTGVTATLKLEVGPAPAPPSPVAALGNVHLVNAEHLRAFARRSGERLVIVQANQRKLLFIAKKLTDALVAAGVKARLWEVKPEEFDSIPVRWYPRPEDTARLTAINEGRLIGYRGNMQPFIDKRAREHVPDRGGYAEIDPPYMVGLDAIVFSGGALAESLRAVTAWMDTPNVPGRGQGRLVVCFSPFMADRQVVAVVGNDLEGIAKAADRLAAFFTEKEPPTAKAALGPTEWKLEATGSEKTPVPQPYRVYTPIRRIKRLLATREGKAVLLLDGKKDTVAFVDETGKVAATVAAEVESIRHARIDAQGCLWDFTYKVTAVHPGWHYPTAYDITLRRIAPNGALKADLVAYSGETEGLPPDYRGGFPVAPDGLTAAAGRKAGILFGKLGETQWLRYDDVPHVRSRHEVRTPRFPVGATFSPDSRYLFFTMDTRPRFGGMGYPMFSPTSCEAMLIEAATGKVVWRLREDKDRKSPYAAHSGFAAVAKDGAFTALADFDGVVYVVDKSGEVLLREQAIEPQKEQPNYREGPPGGVGVWIADSGATSAFGFKNLLVIAKPVGRANLHAEPAIRSQAELGNEGKGKQAKRIPVAGLSSGAVSTDGSLVVIAIENGDVRAFGSDGEAKWTQKVGGVTPLVAAIAENRTLAATSDGVLVLLDAAGKELRRTNVAEAADREKHPLQPSPQFQHLPAPWSYRGPGTLAYAKEKLAAEQVAAWRPDGAGTKAFGLTFHPLAHRIDLSASSDPDNRQPTTDNRGNYFLHLAYRRPQENKKLTLVTEGKDGREEFLLDLPTPEYREIDIPVRGPKAKVSVVADGPVEIADCSLWSFRWPGSNLAFVRPPKAGTLDILKGDEPETGGGGTELESEGPVHGSMKDCAIWWFNTDPDAVAGAYLKPPISPLEAVDGKRFGNGKAKAWAVGGGQYAPYRGSWLTIDLKKPTRIGLVATYDRVAKQSEVAANLSVFSGFDPKESTSGDVLTGAVGNDQFWRFLTLPARDVRVLGVHVYVSDGASSGLSEVEAYR